MQLICYATDKFAQDLSEQCAFYGKLAILYCNQTYFNLGYWTSKRLCV